MSMLGRRVYWTGGNNPWRASGIVVDAVADTILVLDSDDVLHELWTFNVTFGWG